MFTLEKYHNGKGVKEVINWRIGQQWTALKLRKMDLKTLHYWNFVIITFLYVSQVAWDSVCNTIYMGTYMCADALVSAKYWHQASLSITLHFIYWDRVDDELGTHQLNCSSLQTWLKNLSSASWMLRLQTGHQTNPSVMLPRKIWILAPKTVR